MVIIYLRHSKLKDPQTFFENNYKIYYFTNYSI